MDYYPTLLPRFFAPVNCCHLQLGKNAPTKSGSPKFRSIFCMALTTTNGKCFSYFASKCKQVYSLPPRHYWQGFFALECCSVTYNKAKMLPQKMGLPSLRVAFSLARYSLVRDSYHEEYS